MGGSREGKRNKAFWLREAKRRGLKVETLNQSVSKINGKKTNLIFRLNSSDNGWFWTGVTTRHLREMQYFVLIYGSHKQFYVMPAKTLVRYLRNTQPSPAGSLEFNVNCSTDTLKTNAGPFSITHHRDGWELLGGSTRFPSPRKDPDSQASWSADNFISMLKMMPFRERKRVEHALLQRDVKFKKNVLRIYDNSCVICGIKCGIVEAAHIHAVKDKGIDDPLNGLALCPNHHKAFDSSLIYIDEDYKIRVISAKQNELAKRGLLEGYSEISKYDGKGIIRPKDERLLPKISYIRQRLKSLKVR